MTPEEMDKIREALAYCFFEGSQSVKANYHWSKETILAYALKMIVGPLPEAKE